MKRILLTISILLLWMCLQAQNITVASFQLDESDLTANLSGTTVLDQNGGKCALIRIQTTQKGFTFDVGSLGVQKVDDNQVGEVWLYVPAGVKRIDIRHQQLGSLLGYNFPVALKPGKTYKMGLTTGQVRTIIDLDDGKTYFALSVKPAKALVTIDGMMQPLDDDGALMLRLARGRHNLVVQAAGYEPYNAPFELGQDKVVKELVLESALATVAIQCPTPDVSIYVNDQFKAKGKWDGSLMPGDYLLEARKDGYYTQKMTVSLATKEQKSFTIPALTARIGSLDINYKPINSEIYLDGERLGTSPDVFKNIVMGKHTVKISKDGYATKEVTIEITEGQTATLTGELDHEVVAGGGHSPSLSGSRSGSVPGGNLTFEVKGVKFNMVPVEGGTFMMGATKEQEKDAESDEKPAHSVTLSTYYIAQTEVTQALWQAVMYNNPSWFKGASNPVETVSWKDCQTFISRLNAATGKKFRLPTEAEWEYACRGANKSRGYKYSGSDNIEDVAWYNKYKTHPVGEKSPNELGIYDMSGNVREWCQNWFGGYTDSSMTNPAGPLSGSYRVNRGGSWQGGASACRSSDRYYNTPSYCSNNLGLRLALSE